MRHVFSNVVCTIISLVLIVLSLRYLTDFWILSFFYSLQLHIVAGCVVVMLLSLLVRRHAYGFFLLAVSLFIAGHSLVMLREFAGTAVPPGTAPVYRLMSFNILGDNFENGSRIADAVIASGADVVYIFEAPPLETELARIAAAYPYRIGCGVGTDTCDLMLLSKTPIIKHQVESLSDLRRDRFAMADIELGGRIVHFAAAHLSKPYFDDYHTDELRFVAKYLREVDGPLVLGGDFNSATIAPDMQSFLRRSKLSTAAMEPATWPIAAGRAGIAIDHVYARQPLALKSVTRIDDAYGSNHFGLISEFVLTDR
jgi:endonuclease/exonuclease/phosphatase (EEP) superfamily protein YafD